MVAYYSAEIEIATFQPERGTPVCWIKVDLKVRPSRGKNCAF